MLEDELSTVLSFPHRGESLSWVELTLDIAVASNQTRFVFKYSCRSILFITDFKYDNVTSKRNRIQTNHLSLKQEAVCLVVATSHAISTIFFDHAHKS